MTSQGLKSSFVLSCDAISDLFDINPSIDHRAPLLIMSIAISGIRTAISCFLIENTLPIARVLPNSVHGLISVRVDRSNLILTPSFTYYIHMFPGLTTLSCAFYKLKLPVFSLLHYQHLLQQSRHLIFRHYTQNNGH